MKRLLALIAQTDSDAVDASQVYSAVYGLDLDDSPSEEEVNAAERQFSRDRQSLAELGVFFRRTQRTRRGEEGEHDTWRLDLGASRGLVSDPTEVAVTVAMVARALREVEMEGHGPAVLAFRGDGDDPEVEVELDAPTRLNGLMAAWRQGRRVKVTYRKDPQSQSSSQVVTPHTIEHHRGDWYCHAIASAPGDDDHRRWVTLRLDRLESVSILSDQALEPPEGDAAPAFKAPWQWERGEPCDVAVEVDADAVDEAVSLLGAPVAWVEEAVPSLGQRRRATWRVTNWPWVRSRLLGLRHRAELTSPPSRRAELAQALQEIVSASEQVAASSHLLDPQKAKVALDRRPASPDKAVTTRTANAMALIHWVWRYEEQHDTWPTLSEAAAALNWPEQGTDVGTTLDAVNVSAEPEGSRQATSPDEFLVDLYPHSDDGDGVWQDDDRVAIGNPHGAFPRLLSPVVVAMALVAGSQERQANLAASSSTSDSLGPAGSSGLERLGELEERLTGPRPDVDPPTEETTPGDLLTHQPAPGAELVRAGRDAAADHVAIHGRYRSSTTGLCEDVTIWPDQVVLRDGEWVVEAITETGEHRVMRLAGFDQGIQRVDTHRKQGFSDPGPAGHALIAVRRDSLWMLDTWDAVACDGAEVNGLHRSPHPEPVPVLDDDETAAVVALFAPAGQRLAQLLLTGAGDARLLAVTDPEMANQAAAAAAKLQQVYANGRQ